MSTLVLGLGQLISSLRLTLESFRMNKFVQFSALSIITLKSLSQPHGCRNPGKPHGNTVLERKRIHAICIHLCHLDIYLYIDSYSGGFGGT